MARIPEHIVEQIRQSTDIISVIGEVVMLRQRGRNYIGLCPFHNEKTPSFNVNHERGIYKCFGCGKGGDAVKFHMDYYKQSYGEALRALAEKAGIRLEEDHSTDSISNFDIAYSALYQAANFYQCLLMKHEGYSALEYVRGRGFTADTIEKFMLGYAPDTWDFLTKELRIQGFTEETLTDTGLVVRKEETGRIYDRFRGRLMFPIHNEVGRVIGFGARQLADDGMGKYINSPQGLVYDKSKVLYGIAQAKEEIRRKGYVILTEGYADVITVWQAGFKNVVASSGTALTREQLRLLARYTTHLKCVYDADNAGINAALRGTELALEEGFDVDIVRLPQGDDPDSIIRTKGAEAFARALEQAVSFIDFKADIAKQQGLLATPRGQTQAVRGLVETIAKVSDRIKRDFMVQSLAQRFGLRETDVHKELAEALRSQMRTRKGGSTDRQTHTRSEITQGRQSIIREEMQTVEEQEVPTTETSIELYPEEEKLLRVMLTLQEAIPHITEVLQVQAKHFITPSAQKLYMRIVEVASTQANDILHTLIADESLSQEEEEMITGFAIESEAPSTYWKEQLSVVVPDETRQMVDDCARGLILRLLEQELVALQIAQKKNPEEFSGFERYMQILEAKRRIEAQRGLELAEPIDSL